MPNYPWLAKATIDAKDLAARMRVLRGLGEPYTDADIESAAKAVDGKTELDALIAYLQGLGVDNVPRAAAAGASAPADGGTR